MSPGVLVSEVVAWPEAIGVAAAACDVTAPKDPVGPELEGVCMEPVVLEVEVMASLGGVEGGEEGVPPVKVLIPEVAETDVDFTPKPIRFPSISKTV